MPSPRLPKRTILTAMSLTTDQTVSRHVRLSKRLAVDLTFSTSGMVCEWDPGLPRQLTAKELRRYVAARDACASELARLLGGNVVVADLTPDGIAGARVFFPDGRVERRVR